MDVISKTCPKEVPNSCPQDRHMSFGGGEGVGSTSSHKEEHKDLDVINDGEKTDNGDNSQLSSSRWTNLTRVFRLGLAYDYTSDNRKSLDPCKNEQLTDMQKRGSLGKIFRQGLGSLSRPGTAPEMPERPERKGSLWRLFRPGKSPQYISETQVDQDHLKNKEGKSPRNKTMHVGMTSNEGSSGEKYSHVHTESNSLPPVHMRGRALGRFFRQHKDTELSNVKPYEEFKSEIEKLRMPPVSEENLEERAECTDVKIGNS